MRNLIIAGVEVIRDVAGRYNLNALHRASGGDPNHRPNQWLRLKSTADLIEELDAQICAGGHKAVFTATAGELKGTYAHELLVVSYAGWISPAFQLKVNQAFLDMNKKDQDLALPNFNDPAESARAWADQYEARREAEKKLIEAKPVIDFVDKYVDSEQLFSFRQVCKLLGAKEPNFREFLKENKIMYLLGSNWTAYANHLDAGRFKVKTGINNKTGISFNTAYFTAKGVEWVAGVWATNQLKLSTTDLFS